MKLSWLGLGASNDGYISIISQTTNNTFWSHIESPTIIDFLSLIGTLLFVLFLLFFVRTILRVSTENAVLHFDSLVLSILVQVVVLAVCVDHAPPLLFHLPDLVEHRQRLIGGNQQFEVGHRNEGSSAADPSAAVNHWD